MSKAEKHESLLLELAASNTKSRFADAKRLSSAAVRRNTSQTSNRGPRASREVIVMEVKCLEIRDAATFIPVICIHPVADNEGQLYLLRRDGYGAGPDEPCIIMIDAQCRDCAYDPYGWPGSSRTKKVAHDFIRNNWVDLRDGDVVDVEHIIGESTVKKISERFETV